MRQLFRDRRFVITLALTLAVAFSFWIGSRVPALTEKAMMGGETNINALGFDRVMTTSPNDPMWKRIGIEAINWGQTNRKGMAFGVVFGGLMMTLFALVGHRRYRSTFANSAVGTLIGAPLGVCVNCAAPIAAGMASAGARLETTLSTMMSSPSLNVIVLSILFSLFPLHLALLKVGLSLVTVLLLVPLLTRYVFQREVLAQEASMLAGEACSLPASPVKLTEGMGWGAAAAWVARHAGKNLWYVFVRTVPLMLVAGLLGAIMITLLPWDTLARPFHSSNLGVILAAMALIALVGTFLPVPISFDVIVCAVLLAAGMPVKYVAILLFTLGIFSIYSFFIVWQAISPRVAGTMYASVAALGLVAGVGGHYADKAVHLGEEELLRTTLASMAVGADPMIGVSPVQSPSGAARVMPASLGTSADEVADPALSSAGLTISHRAFAPSSPAGQRAFTRIDAARLGIDLPSVMHVAKGLLPFAQQGASISVDDIDHDGTPDLLITRDARLALYLDRGGRFEASSVDFAPFVETAILNAALIDVNGDGWADMYVSTFGKGAWILYNRDGHFSAEGMTKLPLGDDALLARTVAFGDVDHDGRIDLVVAPWEIEQRKNLQNRRSAPTLLLNRGDTFEARDVGATAGAVNTLLLTDFDMDGNQDLVVGVDFAPSDDYLRGDGTGGFAAITRAAGIVTATPQNTMSAASADINNDQRPDLFLAGIARYKDHDARHPFVQPYAMCKELDEGAARTTCLEDMRTRRTFEVAWMKGGSLRQCLKIRDERVRSDCVLFAAMKNRDAFPNFDLCGQLPAHWTQTALFCRSQGSRGRRNRSDKRVEQEIPQTPGVNTLHMATANGSFRELADSMGLAYTGWTWNARFADLDNDGWVDLYVANGWLPSEIRQESNFFYQNVRGAHFAERTDSAGLGTFFPTLASAYVDIDGDGDLDIITVPAYGPIWVFRNNVQATNAIEVQLHSGTRNVTALGAVVTVHTDGAHPLVQRRELQASGGYLSFDEPVVHIGLGEATSASRIDIAWPDGTTSLVDGPIAAGARYRVSRGGAGPSSPRTGSPRTLIAALSTPQR